MRLSPSQRAERNALIITLRSKGYTYDAIADAIHAAGYTDWVINRAAVYKLVKRAGPHLLGNLKRRLDLDRLIRRGDDT